MQQCYIFYLIVCCNWVELCVYFLDMNSDEELFRSNKLYVFCNDIGKTVTVVIYAYNSEGQGTSTGDIWVLDKTCHLVLIVNQSENIYINTNTMELVMVAK